MNRELQDYVWARLPKEFKEEVNEIYLNAVEHHPCGYNHKTDLLKYLFGIHNLTSDAEGEELLTCEKYKVEEALNYCDELDSISGSHNMRNWGKQMIAYLFGSKCLPDELNEDNFAKPEPKPAAPKFRKDEKVRIKGVAGFDVIKDIYRTGKDGYRYELAHEIAIYDESDLEPYTEPEEKSCTDTCTDDCSSQCKSQDFGTIVKDSFRNHDRLHIAAMAMQGLISKTPRFSSYEISNLVRISLDCADALISKCKKGGGNA